MPLANFTVWHGKVKELVKQLPEEPLFNLVITSPPYNIGKEYEKRQTLDKYIEWQAEIIKACAERLTRTGSICWQVGNYVRGTGRKVEFAALDLELHHIFKQLGLQLRNRIIWHYGHGLHNKYRFSGRHDTILWYTKSNDYIFNLDPVRVPAKYPNKKHYKGDKKGTLSGNPLGKNPEDVWSIPNVKHNHIEKTSHPCQFPVAIPERLILALTNENDLVFDPFAGVLSTGVACALHKRRFLACETNLDWIKEGVQRIEDAFNGKAKVRPLNKDVYGDTN